MDGMSQFRKMGSFLSRIKGPFVATGLQPQKSTKVPGHSRKNPPNSNAIRTCLLAEIIDLVLVQKVDTRGPRGEGLAVHRQQPFEVEKEVEQMVELSTFANAQSFPD